MDARIAKEVVYKRNSSSVYPVCIPIGAWDGINRNGGDREECEGSVVSRNASRVWFDDPATAETRGGEGKFVFETR